MTVHILNQSQGCRPGKKDEKQPQEWGNWMTLRNRSQN